MELRKTIFRLLVLVPILLLSAGTESQAQKEQEDAYQEELRKLQKEIESLKLKVLEARKSLKIFEDMILLGTLTGTKLTVFFKNNLQKAEVLEITVSVDGFLASEIKDKEKIKEADKKEIIIYDETEVIPGKHVIDVIFVIQGEQTKDKSEKRFKKLIRYEVDVERGIATYSRVSTIRAPNSKSEVMPEDIDITVTSEKVRLIPK